MNRFVVMTLLLGSVTLVACNPFGSGNATDEANATIRYETAIAAGTQAGTMIALQATVDSAPLVATQLVQLESDNQQLEETVEAVLTLGVPVIPRYTPTPSLVSAVQSVVTGNYVDVRTTTGVDATSGCAIDKKGRFSETEDRVYLSTIGQNVPEEAAHQARWYFDGDLRYESATWIADQSYAEICIYFWLEPSYTAFTPGIWNVDLYVNDEFVISVPFEFCEAGELC